MRAIHASNVMHSCICIKIDSVDGAQRQRSSPLDIIRVTAVDMMKVQLPRDGRAKDGRTDADGDGQKTPERRGRKAGWPDHLGLGQIIKKTGKAAVYNHSHPLWTICDELPHLQLQRTDLENGGCADNFGVLLPYRRRKGVLRLSATLSLN